MTASRSPLDLDRATMRHLADEVVELVTDHLSSLRAQRVASSLPRVDAERLVASPPPEMGTGMAPLLEILKERVIPYHAREPHPGFMAYVPSCPTFPAVLGDWLATGFNFFAGVWPIASGPNALELVVLDWFREWLGMPQGSGGLLTSGGSAATFTAVVAARHRAIGDTPHDLPRLVLYASEQSHSSVARAAWMAGIPRANVRVVPSDDAYRMRVDALAALIRQDRDAGLLPFMVVASAGTTNTGAVDPLHALADLCASELLWLHADAAYAGCGTISPRVREALDGIGRMDSVTIDAHKWLFVPFECGGLLVRDPSALRDAFAISPEYLQDVAGSEENVNFSDYGEQLTRMARALKVWLSVGYFGTATLAEAVEQGLELALHTERLVLESPELELLSPATLGICCFRVHPAGVDDESELERLNLEALERINADGRYLMSSTRLRGRLSLRVCPIGFRTSKADIEGVVGLALG
ncbi:MAG TPA: pyridoxal-dependent decarboxylase [Gemmatimonadaceae bacterium]|nr:pyridoxal-dependent decarboxylase [Gemmatimonadaceae bacterium]